MHTAVAAAAMAIARPWWRGEEARRGASMVFLPRRL